MQRPQRQFVLANDKTQVGRTGNYTQKIWNSLHLPVRCCPSEWKTMEGMKITQLYRIHFEQSLINSGTPPLHPPLPSIICLPLCSSKSSIKNFDKGVILIWMSQNDRRGKKFSFFFFFFAFNSKIKWSGKENKKVSRWDLLLVSSLLGWPWGWRYFGDRSEGVTFVITL